MDAGKPEARTIDTTTVAANGAGRRTPQVDEVVAVLEVLSRLRGHRGGWVDTGAVADAAGMTVDVAAARLRAASKRGLCTVRRSLREGTSWKPSCRPGALQLPA
jgi:hypothetical protein